MKLVVSIVHNRDKNRLNEALLAEGFKFTIIGSSGGFLREGNTTYLIGIVEEELERLKQVIQANCEQREQLVNVSPYEAGPAGGILPTPVKVPVGGAVAFIMDVDEFARF